MITATKNNEGQIIILDGNHRLDIEIKQNGRATVLLDGKEVTVIPDSSGMALEVVNEKLNQ